MVLQVGLVLAADVAPAGDGARADLQAEVVEHVRGADRVQGGLEVGTQEPHQLSQVQYMPPYLKVYQAEAP